MDIVPYVTLNTQYSRPIRTTLTWNFLEDILLARNIGTHGYSIAYGTQST